MRDSVLGVQEQKGYKKWPQALQQSQTTSAPFFLLSLLYLSLAGLHTIAEAGLQVRPQTLGESIPTSYFEQTEKYCHSLKRQEINHESSYQQHPELLNGCVFSLPKNKTQEFIDLLEVLFIELLFTELLAGRNLADYSDSLNSQIRRP